LLISHGRTKNNLTLDLMFFKTDVFRKHFQKVKHSRKYLSEIIVILYLKTRTSIFISVPTKMSLSTTVFHKIYLKKHAWKNGISKRIQTSPKHTIYNLCNIYKILHDFEETITINCDNQSEDVNRTAIQPPATTFNLPHVCLFGKATYYNHTTDRS
jgi:hypothetical protein